jgi:hypothetical protein
MRIESRLVLGPHLPSFTSKETKDEVMLFSADLKFAESNAGPLTKAFLEALPLGWRQAKDLIIDSRVHMLMPNWYPCIPGMHHDDVPRSRPVDSQPNYYHPEYRSEHVMALVNGDICPTEFALGVADFPDVPLGEIYYKVWHPMVMEKIASGELKSYSAPSNQLIFFDDRTWHQGTKAVANGWRWFIRASRNTERVCLNEIRRQVQVYMENPMEGW